MNIESCLNLLNHVLLVIRFIVLLEVPMPPITQIMKRNVRNLYENDGTNDHCHLLINLL